MVPQSNDEDVESQLDNRSHHSQEILHVEQEQTSTRRAIFRQRSARFLCTGTVTVGTAVAIGSSIISALPEEDRPKALDPFMIRAGPGILQACLAVTTVALSAVIGKSQHKSTKEVLIREMNENREADKKAHQEERQADKKAHQEERQADKKELKEEREADKKAHQEEREADKKERKAMQSSIDKLTAALLAALPPPSQQPQAAGTLNSSPPSQPPQDQNTSPPAPKREPFGNVSNLDYNSPSGV